MNSATVAAFSAISVGWLAIAALICWQFSATQDGNVSATWVAMKWLFGLWALSILDLVAISKSISAAVSVMGHTGEKRAASIIQASYWGLVKLACLGIFIFVLIRASALAAPGLKLGLVTGLGTLVIVPLIGGLFWSQRVLRHA